MAHWSIVLIWAAATVLLESVRLRAIISKDSRKAAHQEAEKVESANKAPALVPQDQTTNRLLKFPRSSGRWQLGVVSENNNGHVTIKWRDDEGKIGSRLLGAYERVQVRDRIYSLNRDGLWLEGRVAALNDNGGPDGKITVEYISHAGPVVRVDSSYEDAVKNYFLVEHPQIAAVQAPPPPVQPVQQVQPAVQAPPPVQPVQQVQPAVQAPPPVQPKVKWCDTSLWDCSAAEHQWLRRPQADKLNKGTYGQVWEVVKMSEWNQLQDDASMIVVRAIKYPVSITQVPGIAKEADCKDNREEVAKIKQLQSEVGTKQGCENSFMKLVDEFPCLSPDLPTPSHLFAPVPGYVMDYMRGTLKDWINEAKTQYIDQTMKETRFDHCKFKVTGMVYSALKCFHSNDWVHGDFKVGNVLYKGRSKIDDCPLQVRLADFGLSGKTGSRSKALYSYEQFKGNDYLPMDMFDMPDDNLYPLQLARTRRMLDSQGLKDKPHYIFDPALDWCTFAYAWLVNFGEPICTHPGDWAGDCGPMGIPRSATTGSSTGRRIVVKHCS